MENLHEKLSEQFTKIAGFRVSFRNECDRGNWVNEMLEIKIHSSPEKIFPWQSVRAIDLWDTINNFIKQNVPSAKIEHRINEIYLGADGQWAMDNRVGGVPCTYQEAIDCSKRFQDGLRNPADIGLAIRILDEYFITHRPKDQ